MKRNLAFLSLLIVLLAVQAACVKNPEGSPVTAGTAEPTDENNVVKGVLRVKLTPELESRVAGSIPHAGVPMTRFGVSPLDAVTAGLGATGIERSFNIGGKYEPRQRKAGLHLWYTVRFDEDRPVTRAAASMLEAEGIEIAEPVYMIRTEHSGAVFDAGRTPETEPYHIRTRAGASPFDDPLVEKQWHYDNDGSLNSAFRAGADINLFRAWEITTGTSDVVVAVIDSGIEYTHVDLAANMWINAAESAGTAGVDDDGNGYRDDIHGWNFHDNRAQSTIIDGYLHGTHVAGTVAAVNNNGAGVGGVAGGDGTPGSGARIMACQINSGSSSSPDPDRILKAFQYAADNGAVITQCSWGYAITVTSLPAADKTAIDYFTKFAGTDETGEIQTGPLKGGLAIFATGNWGLSREVYPAAYSEVLAVTSMGADFQMPSYAVRGSWVDVIAPGGSDLTGAGETGRVYSTIPGNSYGYTFGTSMACPHVSGVAALLVSRFGKEFSGLTGKDIHRMITNSTNDIYTYNPSYINQLGSGYLDAYRALARADDSQLTPTAPDLEFVQYNRHIDMQLIVRGNGDGIYPNRYTVLMSERPITEADFDTSAGDVVRREAFASDTGLGGTLTFSYPDLKPAATYYFAVKAHTMIGTNTTVLRREVPTQNFNPPADVKDLKINLSGSSALVSWSITADPDDARALYYDFSYSSKDLSEENWDDIAADITTVRLDVGGKLSGEGLSYMMTGLAADAAYYVAVQGFDARTNESAKTYAAFYTGANKSPEKKKELQPPVLSAGAAEPVRIDLSDYFSNDDPIALSYTVTVVPENSLTYSVVGNILSITPAEGFAGSGTITIRATDFAGLGVTATVGFSVSGDTSRTTVNRLVNDTMTVTFPAGSTGTASVRVYNAAGNVVKNVTSEIPAGLQLSVGMGSVSSGVCTVVVKYGSREDKHTIVKL